MCCHTSWIFVFSVSQNNGVNGSPGLADLDAPGVAPHLTVKKSVTESVFCVSVTTVMCFFPATWLLRLDLPCWTVKRFLHIFCILPLCCLQALMLIKLYTDPLTSNHFKYGTMKHLPWFQCRLHNITVIWKIMLHTNTDIPFTWQMKIINNIVLMFRITNIYPSSSGGKGHDILSA